MNFIKDFTTIDRLNGIIHYLYNLGNGNVFNYLKAEVSSNFSDSLYLMENAFDFVQSTYWIGKDGDINNAYLSFCFNDIYVQPTGFELASSDQGHRPYKFSFSSLNQNKEVLQTQNYSHEFLENEIHYFSFRSPPTKCFQLFCIESIDQLTRFDTSQIEIYGEFHYSLSQFIKMQNTTTFSSFFIHILFTIILLQ